MKVFVVVEETPHEASLILGVYDSLKLAKAKHPDGDWVEQGSYYVVGQESNPPVSHYAGGWDDCVSERTYNNSSEMLLVYKKELQSN